MFGAGYAGYCSHWCCCMVRLFVVYGYQESEEDPEKLSLTDELHSVVLAAAQVVCVRQLMHVVEILALILALSLPVQWHWPVG